MLIESFKKTLEKLEKACIKVYGEDLVTLAVFGSVGRGTPGPESDIDILIVAENLPSGRLRRMEQFSKVEDLLTPWIDSLKDIGIYTTLSPVIKTPEEVMAGSLLFLDMIDDVLILFDREGFFTRFLQEFSSKLKKMGAKKVVTGERWHWVLKPDYKHGEVFEI
ncbi:nucleotidyltransferase domain-containing protein [Thermovorax subterraneus]|jgi:hypothetical protein|nr:nucleotidyltransferase domain-containing protein [Thermovorax subterraneus]